MRQKLIEMLKALEQAWPPPAKCHHALLYAQYGSDADGWTDKLLLQVNNAGVFHPYFLEDADFDRPVTELVTEIIVLLKEPPPANLQVSDALGKVGPNPLLGDAMHE